METNATRPSRQSVLVCGAGFAGLATAHWMAALGCDVVLIEVASGLRHGGTPVDIKGPAVDAVRRMGLLEQVRAASLPPRRMEFKDADDVTCGVLAQGMGDDRGASFEIERHDLLLLLFGALPRDVEVRFGVRVTSLEDDGRSVIAAFADGHRQRFDFVVGGDGLRSDVRRLVFGHDHRSMHALDVYSLLKVVPRRLVRPNLTLSYSVPGRTVLVNGYEEKTDVIFAYRSGEAMDRGSRDRQIELIRSRFHDLRWRTAEFLDVLAEGGDHYFDRIYQVRLPAWWTGRVALVGDAGYCVSPLAGMGGSMALVGATALADALRASGMDIARAFQAYDEGLRPFVEGVQDEAATVGLSMFVPASEAAIAERNRYLSSV